MPVRIALDQNFPLPILECIRPYVPDISFTHLNDMDARLAELDDWELIVALHHLGFGALASNDYHMTQQRKVACAAHQTNTSLILVESLGDDAIRATGALLLDISYIAKHLSMTECRIYRIKRNNPTHQSASQVMKTRASHLNVPLKDLVRSERLSAAELRDPLGPAAGQQSP